MNSFFFFSLLEHQKGQMQSNRAAGGREGLLSGHTLLSKLVYISKVPPI